MTSAELLAERATGAKKIVEKARRRARTIAANESLNRSTRQRHVLKAKADAFDEIEKALAGRT